MNRIRLLAFIFLLPSVTLLSEELSIYGYFEPQYMGIYRNEEYNHINSNKLRIDLQSYPAENLEFKADFIYRLYFGKKMWNILDFLPEGLSSDVPEDLRPMFRFTYSDSLYPDNVYLRFSTEKYSITVGKQQISMGTGYFSNPTDLFNIKDVLDPTYEKPGHNAVKMEAQVASRVHLTGILSPFGEDLSHTGGLLRLKAGMGHFDFSLIGQRLHENVTDYNTFRVTGRERNLLGMDFVGQLFGLGVWGEGAYNFIENDDNFYEFILGGDYTFENGFYALVEYHRNSRAKSDYREYTLNDWMHFFSGERKTISRDQVYGFIQYPATDLLSVGGSFIVSTSDESAALIPTISYNPLQNLEITLTLSAYTGEKGKAYSSTMGNGGFIRAKIYF